MEDLREECSEKKNDKETEVSGGRQDDIEEETRVSRFDQTRLTNIPD